MLSKIGHLQANPHSLRASGVPRSRFPSRGLHDRPDRARHLPVPRRNALSRLRSARRAPGHARRRAGRQLRGVGTECPAGFGDRRVQRLAARGARAGRTPRSKRHLAGLRARGPARRALQVPHRVALQRLRDRESRSLRHTHRNTSGDRLGPVGPRLWLERRAMAGAARRGQCIGRADVRVRSAPGLLAPRPRGGQPVADLSGARARSWATT